MATKLESRQGKKPFQAWITEKTLNRFRAACALVNKDQADIMEGMMAEFSDHAGIPEEPPAERLHPKRK